MVEKFLEQTTFTSQEDFIKNLKIKIPENFNFGYDIVDAWAAEEPDKKALLWTNDKGEHIQYTYADLKKYTDMTASYFQSLGIGMVDTLHSLLGQKWRISFSGAWCERFFQRRGGYLPKFVIAFHADVLGHHDC